MIKMPQKLGVLMIMKKYEIQMISEYIFDETIIDENEFKRYFFELFPNRLEKYFNYYMLDLYKHNILYKYATKKWKPCKDRKVFNFELDVESKIIHGMRAMSPGITVSIWNSLAFSHLTSLQMFNNITIVETYSYAKDYVLNFLLEQGEFAFYEEDYSVMIKYYNKDKIFIVKTLNEECPIVRKNYSIAGRVNLYDMPTFVTVPKIEKIIVDLLVDDIYKILFSDEVNNIIYQLLNKYQINMSTVLRYAKNRHFKEKILKYLEYIGFDVESGEFR